VQYEIAEYLAREHPHTAYNLPFIITTKKDIDSYTVQNILADLINRHESLRTTIHMVNGKYMQKINELNDIREEIQVHCQVISKTNLNKEIKKFIKPFDLTQAPLIRAIVFKTKSSESHIVIDTHYMVGDAISLYVLIKEFIDIYMGRTLDRPSISYKDYCYSYDSYLETSKLKEQKLYWTNKFKKNVSAVILPTDYEWPDFQTFKLDTVYFFLSKKLTKKLKGLASNSKVTLYIISVALFNILLAIYCKQEEIIIGASILERPHDIFKDTVGNFNKILPVTGSVNGNKSFVEFLEEMKNEISDMFCNSDYPLKKIVENTKLNEIDQKRDALINILFVFHNLYTNFDEVDGFSATVFEKEYSRYDLNFFAHETDNQLIYMIRYRHDLFKKRTAKNMANFFIQIAQAVVDNPNLLISQISLKRKGFANLSNAASYKMVSR
jgi:hypothetical protein